MKILFAAVMLLTGTSASTAQSLFDELIVEGETMQLPSDAERGMVVLPGMTLPTDTTIDVTHRLYSSTFYMPLVFDSYDMFLKEKAGDPLTEPFPDADTPTSFFDRLVKSNYRQRYFMQRFMCEHPDIVRYNMATLPRRPRRSSCTLIRPLPNLP